MASALSLNDPGSDRRNFVRRSALLFAIAMVLFVGLGTLLEQARYRVYPFITRDVTMPKTFEVVRDEGGYLLHLPWGVSQPAIIWQTCSGVAATLP